MIQISDPLKMAEQCAAWRQAGLTVALVPTMGYFHQGHESLMQAACHKADKVVVSLFVNPSQFGPNEDLASYPRDLERDRAIAEGNSVDVLFTPEAAAMYPEGYGTWVEVPELPKRLCGKTRPGHFRGVCTIVAKLLLITRPHFALFGQKDWQQVAIIRRMATDLNIAPAIEGCPIVREADGLAMSSRNVYLTPEERAKAPAIYKGLSLVRQLFNQGETSCAALKGRILEFWRERLPDSRVDYLELVDPTTLKAKKTADANTLAITAIYLGKARLLDNMFLGE